MANDSNKVLALIMAMHLYHNGENALDLQFERTQPRRTQKIMVYGEWGKQCC
jgi:hypothetical protein